MASGSSDTQTGENPETGSQSLRDLFQEGLDLYNNLGKIDEPTNSPNVQLNVQKSIRILEDATRLVSLAGIFSTNEQIDEIATEDLRYLLLPALLGALCLKLTSRDRKDIVTVSETYYKDFLQRCNDYGLSNHKFKTVDPEAKVQDGSASAHKCGEFEDLWDQGVVRARKIRRFKEQKELQNKMESLKSNMENENVDDEVKRNYFLTMIQLFIYEAADELSCIEAEKQILELRANTTVEEKPKSKRPPPQPLKPIVITKDAVQKAVFGAGYPSLPVMSVDEFYDKRVRDGIFPDPNAKKTGPLSMQEASLAGVDLRDRDEEEEELKEKQLEEEDPELLEQLRRRDEFKDDHRRGWGNRMNRS